MNVFYKQIDGFSRYFISKNGTVKRLNINGTIIIMKNRVEITLIDDNNNEYVANTKLLAQEIHTK